MAVALLLSGCVGWAGGPGDGSRRGVIAGRATVQIGGHSFPLYQARVLVTGAHSGSASTLRDGSYRYSRLAEGRHNVMLQALHGKYESTAYVSEGDGRPQTLNWRVQPRGLDPETFFQLSGLKRLYIDDWDRVITDPGTLVRWEKPVVRIYFDESGAPGRLPAGTVERYMAELRRWEGYLDYRLAFQRTKDEAGADIAVYWVPEGSLFDHAGIARHVALYANGALKKVEIEIDVAYATFPGLWEHEFAHAMGADHVADRSSVLYPYLLHGQRTTLSSRELAHVRLMYDIPSGQELGRGVMFGAEVVDESVDWAGGTAAEADDWTPDTGFVVANGDQAIGTAGDGPPAIDAVDAAHAAGQREHILRIDPTLMESWDTGLY